jgi:hypothetical protein
MRSTAFAKAEAFPLAQPVSGAPAPVLYGAPEWARTTRVGSFAGADFTEHPEGTLRCPADDPLSPQERRPERAGLVRGVYAARMGQCRVCSLREQSQGQGTDPLQPRRLSAVLGPMEGPLPPPEGAPALPAATQPILWGDGSRSQTRRCWISLLRTPTVTLTVTAVASGSESTARRPLTREQWVPSRLRWAQRLARHASCAPMPSTKIHRFGIPTAFALSVGLALA